MTSDPQLIFNNQRNSVLIPPNGGDDCAAMVVLRESPRKPGKGSLTPTRNEMLTRQQPLNPTNHGPRGLRWTLC